MFISLRTFIAFLGALTFWLFTGLGAADSISTGRSCLRDFPEIYVLQTSDLKADERLARSYSLLAARLNIGAEAVSQALAKEAEIQSQDSSASTLNQARALFVSKAFAKAEQLAISSGDVAHRATPRRIDEMIASLRLAAYAAMELQRWESAIKYLSVAVTESDSQKDIGTWAALQVGIAHAQKNLGLPDERERTLWFIFHEYEQRVGAESVEALHHHNELAACLYERGKDVEAERQTRLILKATLKVRGNDHADTQISRKNLARLLEAQQKFAEAELLRRDVYDVQYRALGGDALTTLKSREQLVLNLLGQKKFTEVETESYAMAKKASDALGKDAPIVLQGRSYEVTALVALKKFELALPMAEGLGKDTNRVLGADHLVTLKVQFNQCVCLIQLKRFTEAVPILTDVLAALKRTLPANDDAILEVHHQLSQAYLGLEKRMEALEHLRVAITNYEAKYGPADPRTQAANQTATTLVNSAEGKAILVKERRVSLAKTSAKLGATHPQTLAEQSVMASFIGSLGLAQEALDEHLIVLAARRKQLGQDDLQTIESLRAVALLEMDLQKFAESETHLRELLAKRQKLLNSEDVAIYESRYHLGLCLGRAGRLGEARPLIESSYLAVKDRAGVNQPFVAQMKGVLDQVTLLTAPKAKNFDSLNVPAPLSLQKAPGLVSEADKPANTDGLSQGVSGPALPNAATLVPAGSIQKHIEVKP